MVVGIGRALPAALEWRRVKGWLGNWHVAGLAMASLAAGFAASAEAQTLAPLYCDTLPGAATLIDRPERVMILADQPGARQVPAALAELACAVSARGPVMVGVDWLTDLQPALDIFMESNGGPRARETLIANLGAAAADVSASVATIDMLERLRQLTVEGRQIRVIAYLIPPLDELPPPIEPEPSAADAAFTELAPDDAHGTGGPFRPAAADSDVTDPVGSVSVGPVPVWPVPVWKEEAWNDDVLPPVSLEEARETFMADMILEQAGGFARILLLATPERARRAPVKEPRLAPYPSLAMTLARVPTLSLDLRHGEGDAWTCVASDCAPRPVTSRLGVSKPGVGAADGDLRMLTVFPQQKNGFDGLWWVGRLSPSAPVGVVWPPAPVAKAEGPEAVMDAGPEPSP